MNRRQKIAVVIGIALIVLSGLFPPYEGKDLGRESNPQAHLGHHFLFTPPTARDASEAIYFKDLYLSSVQTKIIYSQVALQVSVIIIATAGVALVLAKPRK